MMTTSYPRCPEDFVGQWVHGLSRALLEEGATSVTVVAPHDHNTASREIVDGVVVQRFQYWFPHRAQGLCYGAGIPTNIRQRKWLALQFPVLELAFVRAALRFGSDADIYNAHWTFAALPAVLASKLNGKALVTHAYSAEYVTQALNSLNRLVVRSSEAIVSISTYTQAAVERIITPDFHYVIGLGVNREKIAPSDFDAVSFRHSRGIADGQKLIFAVGRLVERKGYHVLIDAMAQLIQIDRSIVLLLAGKGPQKNELEEHILQLGLGEHVRLIGFVPDDQLCLYLKASDLLVMPSIVDNTGDTEGLGLPLIEAMANGTPVVASRIGGIPDIVQHEQSGLLVTPGSATDLARSIHRLLTDDSLRAKVIDGGYRISTGSFSWATIARATLDVFEQAIARNLSHHT